jgi:hypothetical protein
VVAGAGGRRGPSGRGGTRFALGAALWLECDELTALQSGRLDVADSYSPWLSPRERDDRLHPDTCENQTAAWAEMVELHHPRFPAEPPHRLHLCNPPQPPEPPLRVCFQRYVRDAAGGGCAFRLLLRRSLAIRTSDLPPAEKGRQIAKLVKRWMTWDDVHALFGESEAVQYHLGGTWAAIGNVEYSLYGVSVWEGAKGLVVDPTAELTPDELFFR